MPDTAENKGLLVDPKEAFVELLKLPMEKPTLIQKLTGSPSRIAGLIMLALIWIPSAIHYRNVWKESGWQAPSFGAWARTSTVIANPSILIAKDTWTEKVDTTGRSLDEVNVTPPVRRVVMVNGDPNRVYHLAAQNDTTDLGNGVKSWQWMIEPDESVSVATVEYRLSR